MNTTSTSTRFLDEAATNLQSTDSIENVAEALSMLFSELSHVRNSLPTEAWKQFTTHHCRQHPLTELLHQDPFSLRTFAKPRGYPGDAVMLDFIYAVEDGFALPAVEVSSTLGKRLYHCTANAGAARAVRTRRRIIIEKLNKLADSKPMPHVMSLACGHLREARGCSALLEGRIGRYLAVDQDKESLAVVEREVGALGVETLHASVRDFLRKQVPFGSLDLIYASGLYDYLSVSVAQRLTELLFGMLNPGGRLVIANFLPNISSAGYMEAFLDWWLIYRTEAELVQLAETLPGEQIESLHLCREENNHIAFLEVERKR